MADREEEETTEKKEEEVWGMSRMKNERVASAGVDRGWRVR